MKIKLMLFGVMLSSFVFGQNNSYLQVMLNKGIGIDYYELDYSSLGYSDAYGIVYSPGGGAGIQLEFSKTIVIFTYFYVFRRDGLCFN